MAVRQPRYSKEEFAQRGNVLYESQVRSQVEADNHGKIVAIDIETEPSRLLMIALPLPSNC
jgi:uncharacterized protein YuzE